MGRLGDTKRGERSIYGRTLTTVVSGLTGRQAITLEVWSLAPTDYLYGTKKPRTAATTEAVWAKGSDGAMYWVYFDHTTDEVLIAHETRHRAA